MSKMQLKNLRRLIMAGGASTELAKRIAKSQGLTFGEFTDQCTLARFDAIQGRLGIDRNKAFAVMAKMRSNGRRTSFSLKPDRLVMPDMDSDLPELP